MNSSMLAGLARKSTRRKLKPGCQRKQVVARYLMQHLEYASAAVQELGTAQSLDTWSAAANIVYSKELNACLLRHTTSLH